LSRAFENKVNTVDVQTYYAVEFHGSTDAPSAA
jgi:hypothetical protein